MKNRCFVVLFLFVSLLAFAGEKQHQMERGKVIAQNLDSSAAGVYNAPVGTARVAVPIYRRSNSVVIETDKYRYEWLEKANRRPIVLPVNAEIEFYRDGDWFVVLDSNNKKHKFGLVGMTALH